MRGLIRALKRDAERYLEVRGRYLDVGLLVGATYRFGAWADSLPAAFRLPARVPYLVVKSFWRALLNVNIASDAEIGPGLCLVHPRNILIPGTRIGDNFTIFHEVTIGTNGLPPRFPTIGSNVTVFVGARVLGELDVGDGAQIGANCVVTKDVEAGTLVMPAPNRVARSALVEAFLVDRGQRSGTTNGAR